MIHIHYTSMYIWTHIWVDNIKILVFKMVLSLLVYVTFGFITAGDMVGVYGVGWGWGGCDWCGNTLYT